MTETKGNVVPVVIVGLLTGLVQPVFCDSLASAAAASEAVRRLRADVTYLTSDALKGRRAGTPGAEAAAAYIAESFRRIGLLPGATRGSYLQSFNFIDRVERGPRTALTVERGGTSRAWTSSDFSPLPLSAPGEASGPVVFAGYGIAAPELLWDDYAGLDVKGRIVLVLRGWPDRGDLGSPFWPWVALRVRAATAHEKGALALLVATGKGARDAPDDFVSLRTDAAFSDAGLPVLAVSREVVEALFQGSGKTVEAAQKAIDDAGRPASVTLAAHVSLVADVKPHRAWTTNVIGVLPGSDTTVNTDVIVVGAHYDHLGLGGAGSLEPEPSRPLIHPGADDNASGIAGILELARLFAAKRGTLRRTLLFVAFGAEEEGALGSAFFMKNPTAPLGSILAMLNLDMVGRLRDDRLNVHGVGTSSAFGPLVHGANEETRLKLNLRESGFGPSDQSSFWASKVPVCFVFTGMHSDYHRASDTAEKLNYGGEAKVLRFVANVLEGLANMGGSARKSGTLYVHPPRKEVPERQCRRCFLSTAPDAIPGFSPGCWRGPAAPC